MEEKVKEYIELVNNLLYGVGNTMGMIDGLDSYYRGAWDDELAKLEELERELSK